MQADHLMHVTISKTRRCFVYNNQNYQLDIFQVGLIHPLFNYTYPYTVLRIRDVYPGSLNPFFVATNFTKLKIILFFKC